MQHAERAKEKCRSDHEHAKRAEENLNGVGKTRGKIGWAGFQLKRFREELRIVELRRQDGTGHKRLQNAVQGERRSQSCRKERDSVPGARPTALPYLPHEER